MSFEEELKQLEISFNNRILYYEKLDKNRDKNSSIDYYTLFIKINKNAILLLNLIRSKYLSSNNLIIKDINRLIRQVDNYNIYKGDIDKNNLCHLLQIYKNRVKRENEMKLQIEIETLISRTYSYICIYDLENAYKSLNKALNKAYLIIHKEDVNGYKEPEYFIETIEIIKNELFMYHERYNNNLHLYEEKQSLFNFCRHDILPELYKKYWYKFDQRCVDVSFKKSLKRTKKHEELFKDYIPSRLSPDIINRCLIGTIFNDKIFQEQIIPTASIISIEIKN